MWLLKSTTTFLLFFIICLTRLTCADFFFPTLRVLFYNQRKTLVKLLLLSSNPWFDPIYEGGSKRPKNLETHWRMWSCFSFVLNKSRPFKARPFIPVENVKIVFFYLFFFVLKFFRVTQQVLTQSRCTSAKLCGIRIDVCVLGGGSWQGPVTESIAAQWGER